MLVSFKMDGYNENEDFELTWKRKKKRSNRRKVFWSVVLFFVALGIFLSGAFLLWISTFQMPNLDAFKDRQVVQSTKIYDKTGKVLLYEIHQDIKRTVVSFDQISQNLKNATVAIEDADFYKHGGIKISSIIRSFLVDIFSLKFSQGGSTITQQVIKNSLLSSEKTVSRKIKEWVLAMRLEKMMSKEDILNIYLNETSYGGNIYGAEEASQEFFGKSAGDLDVAEAAYLASLPQAPSYYSPYGSHKDDLEKRKNLVLDNMLADGYISQADHDAAKIEKVAWKPQEESGIKAPHFVMFVKEYLLEKYGDKMVNEGGLKVTTTLDYDLEKKAEDLAKQYAATNKTNYKAENLALVAIDPKTGQILTMVGSRDYFDKEIDGNFNVATAHRQPGSSFKPFVYAEAFNKGYTPDTVLFDLQTEFSTDCDPTGKPLSPNAVCYMPQNYDNKFRGPITLRNALAQSVNIPAIKTLYLAGLKDSLNLAKSMGIQSLGDPNQYGLTLVLGGGEVSLLDMTSGYSVFANEGVRNPYTAILKVEDNKGNTLEEYQPNPQTVLPQETAREISDILSDEAARTPLYGSHSLLYFADRDVAVKTGTTNDYKDAWILGYTPNLAVGAWAGNNDNSPMEHKISGLIISPFWRAFMDEALKNLPAEDFTPPSPEDTSGLKPVLRGIWQGGRSYFVDKTSGALATDNTPSETKEERVVKEVHSILYWVNKDDPRGPAPTNPAGDPQFTRWEYPVRQWVAQNNIQEETNSVIPTNFDTIHTPGSAPQISIIEPNISTVYDPSQPLRVVINHFGGKSLVRADFFVNGKFVGSSDSEPFGFNIDPKYLNQSSSNELKVVGYDSVYNKGEATVNFQTQ